MSEYVLGIDLGTTTTIVSVVRDGLPEVIPVEGDRLLLPSVVHFDEGGSPILVGTEAKGQRIFHPARTVFSIKRIIGRTFSHPDTEVAILRLPYKIAEGNNDSIIVDIGPRTYSPQELSSFVLKQAVGATVKRLGVQASRAVITVPANFNEAQRRATQNAGKLAGLEVIRIVNEPTAAALAYGFGATADERVAVYDLGGGTFDMTILETRDKVLDVLSTGGNSFLGGDDMDSALLEYLVYDVEKKFGIRVMDHPAVLNTLATQVEAVKIALTDRDRVKIILRGLVPGERRSDYTIDVSRDQFERLIAPVVAKTFEICDRTIAEAHIRTGDIDAIILVGGATKVPMVQREVIRYFGKEPCAGIRTELVVSMGAAILAHSLEETRRKEDTPVLLDVTPLALGVGTVGDHIEVLIDKNETLPVERTNIFTNAYDDQQEVKVRIYQGEGNKKSESLLMGEIILSQLRKAPRGMLRIEVRFELDTNGVLHVNAVDKDTGQRQHIELNILGLDRADQEIMIIIDELDRGAPATHEG